MKYLILSVLVVSLVVILIIPNAFAIQDMGDFRLAYLPTHNYSDYEEWVKNLKYFEEQIEWLNQRFMVPHDVIVYVKQCGMENAWYQPNPAENLSYIVFCYELIQDNYEKMEYLELHGHEIAPTIFCKPGKSGCPSTETRTVNVIDYTFYHEIGHAVIDLYDLPIPGAEEDIADGLAAYIILARGSAITDVNIERGQTGSDQIKDAAWEYYVSSIMSEELDKSTSFFADEHSLNIQRYYNLACWAYGNNPSNRDLIDIGLLPYDRAQKCQSEYRQLVSSWDKLLASHYQPTKYNTVTTSPSTPIPDLPPKPPPEPIPERAPSPGPGPAPVSDQWGTISVEKPKVELFFTTARDQAYETIKIFGTVEKPGSAAYVMLTLIEPGGKTTKLKISSVTREGNYGTDLQICCNKIGKYTVSAEWRGFNIGTVTFDVVLKPRTQSTPIPTQTPTPTPEPTPEPTTTQESVQNVPDWVRNIFIWYAGEQISENELLSAIKFLVNQGIINLDEG